MGRPTSENPLRIPEALRQQAEEILRLTDGFCADHLDAEYGELCRKLVAELARKRPSPLLRGDLRIWAGAVIYTIGSVNFLFDRTQRPHMTADQLSQRLGLSKSTLGAKASGCAHDAARNSDGGAAKGANPRLASVCTHGHEGRIGGGDEAGTGHGEEVPPGEG